MVDYHSNDEFGALSDNFGRTASQLHNYTAYINEITNILNEIAEGNLVFELTLDYVGEFNKINVNTIFFIITTFFQYNYNTKKSK